ncbi:MAG: 16S rRNA (adenine(1518)-N(6)/adenine(1519)-N(6))-dimethyltransferase RsmA [Bacilli bacterium]|nr:16S rRNA (adenine(1518)-N(6)/adenine(1519)-N(6))-dimethyltransferase RsmA [Bacilli bacterium]
MYYSPIKMKELLNKHGFNLKKIYGQNFIIDENIITNIINAANIDKETLVIEIGPGAGSLTYKLSEKAKNVICYEIDTTLKEVLNETLKEKENVEIVYQDFLKANVLEQIKKYEYKKLYVVANLPYYITTPIIIKIIEDNIKVDKMVVMVQKEVGDRFKATPGSKDYSSLSVFLNYYFDVKKLLDISKNVFLPKPNVDSIVVEFKKKENLKEVTNKELFFKLIRDAFKQKRKTLKNNLKEYNLLKIEEILKKYNYDLSVRAEQLTIDIFIEIANNLKEENKC